jgi:RsiW-degrading membrane proteinase PrsW (M82 family)
MVGLLSGIGFGVSEGIHYSSDFYNGVLGADVYCVRFISCVALHAVWSGSAAVFIFRHQAQLQASRTSSTAWSRGWRWSLCPWSCTGCTTRC